MRRSTTQALSRLTVQWQRRLEDTAVSRLRSSTLASRHFSTTTATTSSVLVSSTRKDLDWLPRARWFSNGNDKSEGSTGDSNSGSSATQEEQPAHHVAAKHLIQHVRDNGGLISNEFLEKDILENANVETLLHLAKLIRDQIPHLRAKAVELLEKALELQHQEMENEPTDKEDKTPWSRLAQIHTEIGIVQHQLGEAGKAHVSVSQALELRQEHLGKDNPETAATLIHLGMLLQSAGNYDQAIASLQTALGIQSKHVGEGQDHPILAASHNNLGALFYRTSQFDKAVEHYSKALQMYQNLFGEQNNDTAGTYNNLAVALKFQQTPEAMGQALEHCRKSLEIRQEMLGPKHADTAASHYSLAQLLSEVRPPQLEESLEHYRTACDIQKELYGETSPIVAATFNNIGAIRYQMNDLDGSLEEYTRALETLEASKESNPNSFSDLAATQNNRGIALYQKGDLDGALEAHEQAKSLLKEAGPRANESQLAMTIGSIGNIYKAQGRSEEALKSFQEAHALLEKCFGKIHTDVAASHNNMGLTLSALGRFSEAAVEYQNAQQVFAATLGSDHLHVGSCHFNIALSLVQQHQQLLQQQQLPADGEELLNQARKEFANAQLIFAKTLGMEHAHSKLATKYTQDPLLALQT